MSAVLAISESGARRVALIIRPPQFFALHMPGASDNRKPLLPEVAALDRRRRSLGLSHAALAVKAGVDLRIVERMFAGRTRPLTRTLARIERALAHGQAATAAERGEHCRIIRTCYRAFVAAVAAAMRISAEAVLADNPRAHGGPAKARAMTARCRMRAYYLTVVELDLPMSEVAVAIGITKQAISKAMRDIEDEREDGSPIDAMLDRVAIAVTGGL